jgi:hypothetical protein
MAAGRSTPAAADSRPSPGVVRWWPFRAQLPVRTAAPPEGAFSAQTPPARPFSYPAPNNHPRPHQALGSAWLLTLRHSRLGRPREAVVR